MKKPLLLLLPLAAISSAAVAQVTETTVNTAKITLSDFKPDRLDPPTDTPTTKSATIQVNDSNKSTENAYDYHVVFSLLPFKGKASVSGDENGVFQEPKTIRSAERYKISWDTPNPIVKGTSIELLFSVQIPISEAAKITIEDAYWTGKDHTRIPSIPEPSPAWLLFSGIITVLLVSRPHSAIAVIQRKLAEWTLLRTIAGSPDERSKKSSSAPELPRA